jgi:NAD(P)-dependent dehydrogenase (short-subunit alcohol dehydrogenase family)
MIIDGKVALITGGASGLGEASVRNFIANGGKAVILDLEEDRGQQLAAEYPGKTIFVKTDVVSEEGVQNAVDETLRAFGSIHVVVNCAGIGVPQKVLGKQGPHDLGFFNKVIQINLVGTFNVIRLAAEKMVNNEPDGQGERGVIINTASAAAFEGQIGQAAYSASKNGVVGMTLPIARELAEYGIRVMTIAPGIFETPMLMGLPEKVREALGKMVPFPPRLGRPAEFAQLVQQIVENTMLNGFTIRLDGAIRMQPR